MEIQRTANPTASLLRSEDFKDVSKYLQVSFVISLIALSFFPVYQFQREHEQDYPYAIARGAGAAIKLLLPFIFLPTLRVLHAKTYKFLPKNSGVSLVEKLFHHRMSLHKYLAEAFIATALLHTAAHLFRHSVPLSAQESITGITMLVLSILPIASMYALRSSKATLAHWAFDKSYYRQFLIPHQLGWWGLAVCYAVHTRDLRLIYSTCGFFGLFCVDRIWEWAESRNVTVKNIHKIHNDLIVIEVEKPKDFEFQSGYKAYLAYPPATAFVNNLHPFTIASSPDENILRFVISRSGDWTTQLVNDLTVGEKVRLSPGFPSPLDNNKSEADRLLITSGSGIAMTLAHLHDISDKTQISIIHTSRNKEEFQWLDTFTKVPKFKVKSFEYYDTSGETPNRFNPAKSKLFSEFEGRVFFCGNEALGDAVEKAVHSKAMSIFFREKFNL